MEMLSEKLSSSMERWDDNLFVADADFFLGQIVLFLMKRFMRNRTHPSNHSRCMRHISHFFCNGHLFFLFFLFFSVFFIDF